MKTTRPSIHHPHPFQQTRLIFCLRCAMLTLSAGMSASVPAWGQSTSNDPDGNVPVNNLPAIVVQGSASGQSDDYVAKRSGSGTKTDTPIEEIPQSISVVTNDQIRDTGAHSLQDILGYTAGVSAEQGSYGALTTESFVIRGFEVQPFEGGILRDGLKYQPNVYNGPQEPYGLERVEVLKGASSILYGAGAPGGVINVISKRPSADPVREVNVEIGNNHERQVSADYGGAIDSEGKLTYRLTGLERKADSYVDFGKNDRTYIAPAITWRPSAATSFTLLTSYQRSKATDNGNLPLVGTLAGNPNGQLPVSRYLGEPSANLFDNKQSTVGYLFEHAFNDALTVRQSLRYFHSSLDYSYYQLTGLEDDQRTVNRRLRTFKDNTNAITADTNLEYKTTLGPIKHTFLVGVDYIKQHHDSDRYNTGLDPIDIYAPVYGQPMGDVTYTDKWRLKQQGVGVYAQDQMKIHDKWVVLLGGRHDWTKLTDTDELSNPGGVIQRDHAFSGRAGLVYLADNGLAPYISFSQSFAPEEGTDRLGKAFKPTKGEQYEVGVRYQTAGDRLLLTAALYQLTQTNVQTPDPVDPENFDIQTGAIRSRGLELEAKGQLTRDLDIATAYTYTQSKTTESNDPTQLGAPQVGVPRTNLSLWLNYRFARFGLPNLRVGSGVRYVGVRAGNTSGVPAEPSYTLFDALVSYDSKHWKYALNATNVANKKYVPSPCYANSCAYGQARAVRLTATYRW